VSGTAGLLWSAAPSSEPTDISSAIMAGVDARPAFAGKTVSGGRLNVLRSLRLVADIGNVESADPPSAGGSGSGSPSGSPSSGTAGGSTADAVPPRLSVRVRRTVRTSRLVRRGLAVRVRCSESCTVRLILRRRGRGLSAARRLTLSAGVSRRVVVRVNRAGRTRLRRHRSLALTLVGRGVDSAGNSRTLKVGLRASR